MKSSGATESSAADAPAEVVGGQVVADPRIKLNPLQRRFALAFAGILAVSPFFVGMTGLLQPEALRGDASVMRQRAFGTCLASAPSKLRWNAAVSTADRISCFNRAAAEFAGYWRSTDFLKSESAASGEITFYDTISGKPLFIAPRGRTFDEFVAESNTHGWPSFRDQEVVAENVRVLSDGETVSADGTHLGHNLPDMTGNRYCINIVSIAGFGDQKN
jgi:peptide methionine sulfoxide reductase MsrB